MTPRPSRPSLFPYTTLFRSVDGMIHDGLWDSFGCCHMGEYAEYTAEKAGVSREDQDAFAYDSHRKALAAMEAGNFKAEDRKSTRLNSSHQIISYAVFCLKKK